MKTKTIKTLKHYRKRVEDQPNHTTRYFSPCGASGTSNQEFTLNLDNVNCLKCYIALKVKPKR